MWIPTTIFLLATVVATGLFFLNHPNYAQRFQQLLTFQDIGVRWSLWKRAINLILDFPITGSGVGTFYRYSALYHDWDTEVFRNAQEFPHNYFLQFAADLGLPALIILLSLLFAAFKIGFSAAARDPVNAPLARGLLWGLSAYLLTNITGYPLFLDNQIFIFWFLLGLLVAPQGSIPGGVDFSKAFYKTRVWKIGFVILLAVGYFPWVWNLSERRPLTDLGFHPWEPQGKTFFHWTTKKTVTNLFSKGPILHYELSASPQFTASKPQRFFMTVNGQLMDQRNFFFWGSGKHAVYLPKTDNPLLQIRTEVDQVFNTNRVGLDLDTRERGVYLSEYTFSDTLPETGIGFYEPSPWAGTEPPGWPAKVPFQPRWTALRASMRVPTDHSAGLDLWVFAGHPDLAGKPVNLKIFGEAKLLRQESFRQPGWKKIALDRESLKEIQVLTFQVDRVWNPKMFGSSEDTRDLGVAVAVPRNNTGRSG